MDYFNQGLEDFVESLNLLEVSNNKDHQFALANDYDPSRFLDCVIYSLSESSVVFSFKDAPPVGVPFTKISQTEAMSLVQIKAERLVESDVSDSDSAEIVEISAWQMDLLEKVRKGETVSNSEDTEWLIQNGLLVLSPGGNVALSPFARDWIYGEQ